MQNVRVFYYNYSGVIMVSTLFKRFIGTVLLLFLVLAFRSNGIAGEILPPFSFFDPVEGATVQSGDYIGQPTLLIFFANVDEIDQSQIRMVSGIKDRYADTNLQIAVVCIDPDESGVLRLMVKHHPEFKILIPGREFRIEPGNTGLPTFLLMNADLGIVKKLEGKEEAKRSLLRAIDHQLNIRR